MSNIALNRSAAHFAVYSFSKLSLGRALLALRYTPNDNGESVCRSLSRSAGEKRLRSGH